VHTSNNENKSLVQGSEYCDWCTSTSSHVLAIAPTRHYSKP